MPGVVSCEALVRVAHEELTDLSPHERDAMDGNRWLLGGNSVDDNMAE